MMSQALFYIDFERKDFFTLIGGINIVDMEINKESVETMDYVKDFRILIEGSGISSLDISTTGIIDPDVPKELFQKFYTAIRDGLKLKCRLVKSEGATIEGDFIIQNLSSTMPNQEAETFNLNFLSSGEFNYSFD